MDNTRLTPRQRAELAWMQVGQVDLIQAREEYELEFSIQTIGGRLINLKTTIRYEDGIPALARLRQLVLALDGNPDCTVLEWRRTFPAWPTTAEM